MPKRHAAEIEAHENRRLILPSGRLTEAIDNEWLGLGDTTLIPTANPFNDRTLDDIEHPAKYVLGLMRKPEMFGFTCKHLMNKTITPMQMVWLWELWHKPFPMLLGSRGSSKSWTLALYLMLRALFCQGSKIVVVGAAFRQAKVVFDYCESIWQTSPLLRDMVGTGGGNGPRHEADCNSLRLGESIIKALPLGDGTRIRGQRASIVAVDEFASVPLEIFELVVEGFAAVSLSPVEKMQMAGRLKALKRMKLVGDEEQLPTVPGMNSNQTIISGTAYYRFNHFYKYWCRYKAIIESRGDKKKLEEIFNGEVPTKFDWKDFCIIRVPVKLLPEGFMDERHVAKARATLHASQFQIDYGACALPGTKILTPYGVSPIESVQVGDLVLTHNGRFKPVTQTMRREYAGPVVKYRTLGFGEDVSMTAGHPFWVGDNEWKAIGDLEGETNLARLAELNGMSEIDIRDYVDSYTEIGGKVFPRAGSTKITDKQRSEILKSNERTCDLVRRLGVKRGMVNHLRSKVHQKAPKTAIPPIIKLDYKFGLVMGYYLAEGSVSRNTTAFALDGHVDVSLQEFVNELAEAIEVSLGIKPKRYKSDGVVNVTICQGLIAKLFSKLCPGKAKTKYIDPHILFSNADFLKGVVRGYWNGDGHKQIEGKKLGSGGSANQSLLAQMRLALSYFGISSALSGPKRVKASLCNGRPIKAGIIYTLAMYGDNIRRFYSLFYGQELPPASRTHIKVSDSAIHLPITSKTVHDYSGPVYNLEVAADNSYSLGNATVHNCWPKDSEGFFKRTLIESCVAGRIDNPIVAACGEVDFTAVLRGERDRIYVMGVDPASESDNFAIVILELWGDHRRVVYCWTTNNKRHKARLARHTADEHDYYNYVGRKIRELMVQFPITHISMDKMGGGISVMENLADPERCKEGEIPILLRIDEDDPKPSDRQRGDHILELCYFAKADWVAEANHGMKKDMESKVLLFPAFDSASIGLAMVEDREMGRIQTNEDGDEERLYDTLEDCALDIEELKEELASIVHTQVGTSRRDHWDTPEGRSNLNRKTRTRKDRYSALLMANMAARTIAMTPARPQYLITGGFAEDLKWRAPQQAQSRHQNPSWYEDTVSSSDFGAVVRHGK